MVSAVGALAVAFGIAPDAACPAVALPAGHLRGQIHADQTGPVPGKLCEAGQIRALLGIEAECCGLGAGGAQVTGQPPGVDAGDPDQPLAGEPAIEMRARRDSWTGR